MNKSPETNIRSVIYEIALRVAEASATEHDLRSQIADKAIAHTIRLRHENALSNAELDRIVEAIVRDVLRRLKQIADSGRQIGSA